MMVIVLCVYVHNNINNRNKCTGNIVRSAKERARTRDRSQHCPLPTNLHLGWRIVYDSLAITINMLQQFLNFIRFTDDFNGRIVWRRWCILHSAQKDNMDDGNGQSIVLFHGDLYIMFFDLRFVYEMRNAMCIHFSFFSLYISVALPARLSYRFTFADEQHNILVATIRSTLADMSVSVCVCRRLFLDRQRVTWEWNRKR